MGKRYYIKEFSETFGISTAALRYYEKIGILCPKRDQNNFYRYYTDEDCHTIMTVRMLRSFGFTVNEIKGKKWISEENSFTSSLQNEISRTDSQIKLLLRKKKQLEYYNRTVGLIQDKKFKLGIETIRKKFLFYDQMIEDDLIRPGDPNGITYDLYENMPLTMAGTLFEFISKENPIHRHGLLIEEEDLPEAISERQMDEQIEIEKCIHMIISYSYGEKRKATSFKSLYEYACALGYSNADRALCIIIPSPFDENSSYLDCYILI